MSDKTFIKGTFSRKIYQSDQGYYIGIFRVIDTNSNELNEFVGRTITFTGYFHELNDCDTYIFYGKLVNHVKYGEQFQVDSYERCMPEEKDSIVEFLSSDLFPGIGERKAKRIVDTLGKDTLKIILDTPNNLVLIPTITHKNIDTLYNKLKEYESSYEIILYLGELGFNTKDAMIIYNTYKNKTRSIIEEDIYKIVNDIVGLGFKKIDLIALNSGISKDDIRRVKASIKYIMTEISNILGHSYYSYTDIASNIGKVLGINIEEEVFQIALDVLEKDLEIVHKEDRYYLRDMYDAETFIVKRFRSLNKNTNNIKDIDSKLEELEKYLEIEYNDEQKEAIKSSIINDFTIITGGPGTGKTTILRGICELYRLINKYSFGDMEKKIALLAPTGRAAKRMSEATLFTASTIHRFLKWNKDNNKFQVNEYNKSKVEFVIIDESSMIDTYLMNSLLKGLSSNCKILMIGDGNQLPSVGPGQVLHDLITSNMLNLVELKRIYRQGNDSNIISLAYDILNKEISEDIFNVDEDLTFIKCRDNEVIDNIIDITSTYSDLSYKKFQILAPMYKGLNGIDEINKRVQAVFNAKDKNKDEIKVGDVVFRVDDKVIQLTNMPDDNVYNGDIGLIDKIENGNKKEIYIDFSGNKVKYTSSNFVNFRQAYAISIHKSQGSEFDVVVLPIVRGYNKMLYQKLIYTAVTRAKKKLYIIGDIAALKMACKNTYGDIRKTTICRYLIEGII